MTAFRLDLDEGACVNVINHGPDVGLRVDNGEFAAMLFLTPSRPARCPTRS